MLALPAMASADDDLHLRVRPSSDLPVGERACVEVATLDRRSRPVGAKVVFDGKRTRLGPDGHGRACATLRWGGEHAIHAYRRGAHAFKSVRTAGGAGLALGRWVPISFGLTTIPPSARCHLRGEGAEFPVWGQDTGLCATGGGGTIAGRDALDGVGIINFYGSTPIWFVWSTHPSFDAGHSQYFYAHSPSPTSDQFIIETIETFRGQCMFEGGTDPDRIGRPGGPARLSLHQERSGGRIVGFQLGVDGYVFERGECRALD